MSDPKKCCPQSAHKVSWPSYASMNLGHMTCMWLRGVWYHSWAAAHFRSRRSCSSVPVQAVEDRRTDRTLKCAFAGSGRERNGPHPQGLQSA